MTLTIDLPPDVMIRLQQEADRYGLAVTDLAGSLIDRGLDPGSDRAREERLAHMLARVDARVPQGVAPEQVEADAVAAVHEARDILRARRC
jgi:hypothetical protein